MMDARQGKVADGDVWQFKVNTKKGYLHSSKEAWCLEQNAKTLNP